jgi:hypothetical protein
MSCSEECILYLKYMGRDFQVLVARSESLSVVKVAQLFDGSDEVIEALFKSIHFLIFLAEKIS